MNGAIIVTKHFEIVLRVRQLQLSFDKVIRSCKDTKYLLVHIFKEMRRTFILFTNPT